MSTSRDPLESFGSGKMKKPVGFREGPDPPAETVFLSRGEVSRLFGVSPSTVTRWARLGLLKAARTRGGHYRFPAEETRRAAGHAADGDSTHLD